ncbi:MAG: hypothetical protein J0M12_00080 [Deltaproteobacteria bacterium]|nr:hypothetical protein [Deltaproteobacteria bacterium]
MQHTPERALRELFFSTAAFSVALMLISLAAQHYFVMVKPIAVMIGCVFALFNLLFFKYLSAGILGVGSVHRGLAAALALLKLPLLALLVYVLSRQSAVVIANVLAGSLVFIPGALMAGFRDDKSDAEEADRQP